MVFYIVKVRTSYLYLGAWTSNSIDNWNASICCIDLSFFSLSTHLYVNTGFPHNCAVLLPVVNTMADIEEHTCSFNEKHNPHFDI